MLIYRCIYPIYPVYLYAYLSYVCSLIYIRYIYSVGIGFLCGPYCTDVCMKDS